MRSALLKAASLALMFLYAATIARAGVTTTTISDDNGHVVVQFDCKNLDPPTLSPLASFFVAISPTGSYSAKFMSGPAFVAGKGSAPQPSAALDTLTLSTPFQFRGSRVLFVRVQIPGNTPVSHVEITYTPAPNVASPATADPLVRELVVNETVFPTQPATGSPGAWFARAAGWAKLSLPSVNSRGMYAVSGSDLIAAGINLSAVVPSTLRLYTQGGLNQPRDFVDSTGTWLPDKAMREVAIRVEAGSDGTFDPGDRVIFYGVGTRDWADYYDRAAPDTLFHEHTHASTNYYYLAWETTLLGAPLRMSDVDGAPVAGPDRTTYTQREYRERDLISDLDYGDDGWLWLDIDRPEPRTYRLDTVPITHLVSSVPQELLSVGLAVYGSVLGDTLHLYNKHHAVFKRGSNVIGHKSWETQPGQRFYEHGVPIRFASNFLIEGNNDIGFQVPGDVNPYDKQLFAWFALRYERRIAATGDAVGFSTPDSTGLLNVVAKGFSASGTLYLFDVTDPWNPLNLTGAEVTPAGSSRNVRAGLNLDGRRQLWAATSAALRKPTVTRITPVDLRVETAPPTMVIITHRDMRAAADRLRAYRAAGRVPLFASSTTKVVTTDDIFENFSGGMPDPMAIRNYVKYLFDNYQDVNGNPRLGYALFLGDATEDFQNHASTLQNFVPSNLYFTRKSVFTFSTDDWFGHMDDGDIIPGHGVLDIAVGRLPAASADEAGFLVDKVIAYETEAPRDDWRQRVILVADDENSALGNCELEWTKLSEQLRKTRAAEFLAVDRIYLVDYPAIAGVKPTSRLALLDEWNKGALIINYIGHGSPVQMADEQVYLASDASQLVNGLRLPILMAFSCTVGDFANPAAKSLSEGLLLREGGGGIATITASEETYATPNQVVCDDLFDRLVPERPGDTHLPIGVALMTSKLNGQVSTNWSLTQEENSWKYNLLGDPALLLASPREAIRFNTAAAETLVAGARHVLRGAVRRDGQVDTGFNGPARVTVREPAVSRLYKAPCGQSAPYLLPGGPIYQGTVDVVNGQFEVSFRVPRFAATGKLAYAGAYAHEDADDAAASMDSVLVVVAPTLADSLALAPVDGAPRVDLGFKSGLQVVKPGDTVQARVRDADGINILNTTNEGRQAILIDALPVPLDVNEFFSFDHGGVDTSGVLLFPLPDLSVGHHRLVYKVSDSFGSTTLDTLQFDVTDATNYYAEAAFNFPNPFTDSTRFLFRVSNRASIKLELFTVSGKFVRRIEELRDGGEVWVQWDGRNAAGGDVANGSYLYVATIDFVGVDRPPVILRGALSRIR